MHFGAGIAVTVAAAWSLSSWQASASVSADESTFVSVSPARVLDTRSDLGLPGPFVSAVPQDLMVTGNIATANGDAVVVPDGATGVVLNVTAVNPGADGFVTIRPADAPGAPTTSNLNFKAGDIIPNSVTVQVPTSGADAGRIEITYDAFGNAGPTTEILIDIVGYTKNAGLASLQAQVDALQATVNAATAPNAITADQIAPAAITSSELAPGAVTLGQIAPGAVNSTNIVNNSITAENLGPDSVGASELINGTVGLTEMNAAIIEDRSISAGVIVNQGACSADIPTAVPAAPIGTRALVLVSRLTVIGDNPGWIAAGGAATSVVGQVNIKICNETAANNIPPALFVSFIALGP